MSFLEQWLSVSQNALDKLRDLRANKIGSVCHDVIELTPVDSGYLKNSWRTNVGNDPAPDDEKQDTTGSGIDSHTDLVATLSSMGLTDTITFANHRHYAEYIEFDGHSSTKAPAGMLRVALSKWSLPGTNWTLASKRGVNGSG